MSERDFDLDLEAQLKQELRRVDAPEGFADSVMGRVAKDRSAQLIVIPRRKVWMAIAAMLLVGIVLSGWQWRQQELRRKRQEAEVARRQFEVAMHVTGRTLVEVQERIGRAGAVHSARRKREAE